jgi:hypothetical protein
MGWMHAQIVACAQVADRLPSKYKALNSNPSTVKKQPTKQKEVNLP